MDDQSYGIVPVHTDYTGHLFLIVRHSAGHWAFPKGHSEGKENPVETALRELSEETGVNICKILDGTPITDSYTFLKDGIRTNKQVDYFLGEISLTTISLQIEELSDYALLRFAEALERLTFPETREVLRKAQEVLFQIS